MNAKESLNFIRKYILSNIHNKINTIYHLKYINNISKNTCFLYKEKFLFFKISQNTNNISFNRLRLNYNYNTTIQKRDNTFLNLNKSNLNYINN